MATNLSTPLPVGCEPGLFGPIEIPARNRKSAPTEVEKATRGSRLGLSWHDFEIPQLVSFADNGDPAVVSVSSTKQTEQALHMLDASRFIDSLTDEKRERKRYAQSLKRDSDRADELARFLAGDIEAEESFHLWLSRKLERRRNAFQRKVNRLLACSVIARPMDCLDCGLKGYIRWFCGNRYCRYCGEQIFRRLFAKYIRLQEIVERLIGPGWVLATFTFTTSNLGRIARPEEVRKFNEDVRTTLRHVCKILEIKSTQFGALWCDEFGGWNDQLQDYNTNLHCHGLWFGPFIPLKLVSKIWSEVRGNGDYRVVIESVPCHDGRPSFARALGHALKYTSKHVSTYSPERLAELELAFNGVRRVHTMGLFYNASESRKEPASAGTPPCPRCNGQLAYPRNAKLQFVKDLEKEGRIDLELLRRQAKLEAASRGSPASKAPSSVNGEPISIAS